MNDLYVAGFLRERFLFWFLFFLCLSAVFDPSGMAKIVLFSFALLTGFLLVLYKNINSSLYWPQILFVCILCYGVAVTLLKSGFAISMNGLSHLSAGYYFLALTLFLMATNSERTALIALRTTLRMLSFLIIGYGVTSLLGIDEEVSGFFEKQGLAVIGERDYGGVELPYFYFVTSPMLLVLLAWDYWKLCEKPRISRFFLALSTSIALGLTGTRANLLLAFLGPIFIITWQYVGKIRAIAMGLLILGCGVMIAAFSSAEWVQLTFGKNSFGIEQKLSYIETYKQILSDWDVLVFGQGFNAIAWSGELRAIAGEASITELTYLDIFRIFGMLFGGLLLGFLILPILGSRLRKNGEAWLEPGWALYLLASSVNPYIFSSNGMLLFGITASVWAGRRK